jgi:formylglycine-generating enzyme required for sulfatase activity
MNCLVPWEAERYCKWAGKRLATDVEWEYVARSRRTENSLPWGAAPDIDCKRSACTDATPQRVCSIAAGDTIDGVCDMMGNVAETVVAQKIAGAGMPQSLIPAPRGSSVYSSTNFVYETNRQVPFSIGFRCTRGSASLPEVESP